MLMVTIVKPIAISGETSAIVFDRSARFSSTSCMSRFLLRQTASAHQQAELLAGCIGGDHWLREAAVEHHGNPIGYFGELVEVLARHQHGGAARGEIEQGLPNDGGSTSVHAPGRLADHKHGGAPGNFPGRSETFQGSPRPAFPFRVPRLL